MGDEQNYVLPASVGFLRDNAMAHDLIDALRWIDKPHCPRCTSNFVKRVNTTVFRQLYRCVDCGYMFNSLSGTIFHGAKMPLYKFFQFFIMQSAVGDHLELREICYALDVSHKTASILMRRAADMRPEGALAVTNRRLFDALVDAAPATEPPDAFDDYCAMKAIVVDVERLRQHIGTVARNETGMRAVQDASLMRARRG